MKAEFRRGWTPLLAAFVGTSLGISALFFYSFGAFIKPVSAAFGWTRTDVASAMLIAGACSAVMAPVVGSLADRFGVPRVGCVSLAGVALGFGLLSRADGFGSYLGATIVLAVAGAGSSAVVFSRLVNLWFDRARGFALGIAASGTGVAGLALPALLPGFVASHGWRAGYLLLAAAALLAVPAVGLLATAPAEATTPSAAGPSVQGFTLLQACRMARFWRMALAFFLVALASSGFIVHFIALLTDRGLAPNRAGGVAGLVGLAVIAGRIGAGLVIDRIFAPYVAGTIFAISSLGCLVLALAGTGMAAIAALMVGFSFGAEVDLVAFLTSRFFGMRAFGAAYGVQYGCFTAGVAVGPIVAGILHDRLGTYVPALLTEALCLAIAGALVATLGAYPKLLGVQTEPAQAALTPP